MTNKVSIVVPTRNEELNIRQLLEGIKLASKGAFPFECEVLVVDDGTDRTAAIASGLGARVIQGEHKGLGQAIIDGIRYSYSDVVVVMDGDGSHSPSAIPDLIRPIFERGIDFTVGSRFVKGGDASGWSKHRRFISHLSSTILAPFMGIKDTNSGFFAVRKSILEGVELKPDSWKTMLEVLFKAHWSSMEEVPIQFVDRKFGQSKNSLKQIISQSKHTIKLLIYKYRFLKFGMVGATFAAFHFGLLYGLTEFAHVYYLLSAIISEVATATCCYTLNHFWTFERMKIKHGWFAGWLKYISVDGLAALAYIGMIALFTEVLHIWYIFSAMAAVCINYPIKYSILSRLVWEAKPKDTSDSKDFEWRAFYRANPLRKAWKRAVTSHIVDFVNRRNTGSILEFGCGSSPTVTFLNHNHYIGVDLNTSKIEYMNGKHLPGCEFMVGDNLKGINGQFDTVLCIELLEHLSEPRDAIRELAHKVSQGGRLIIATPNRDSLFWQIVEKAQRTLQPTYHTSQHVHLLTRDDVDAICAANGLYDIDHKSVAFGMDMVLFYDRAGLLEDTEE